MNAGASDQQSHTFTWKRTHSLSSSRSGGLKLVEESNQVVAVLSSGRHFSTMIAQMDVFVKYGDRFQLLVLALREKLAQARRMQQLVVVGVGGGAS